jgi:hypothetical protein
VGRVKEFQLGNHFCPSALGEAIQAHHGGVSNQLSDILRNIHSKLLIFHHKSIKKRPAACRGW